MSETSDSDQFYHRFSEHDKQEALDCLDHFINDEKEYYVIYQKNYQTSVRELKFNQVEKNTDNHYRIAMHQENMHDSVCYYNGEKVELTSNEILKIRIVDPKEYEFVVYTD